MSKLEELIQKLCPNGVEYKRFDEACTLNARIGWQRLTKAEYKSSGEYLLITGTDFTSSYEVNYSSCVYVSEERYLQDKKIQIKNGDVLITKDGTLGKVAQVSDLSMPATLNGGVFVVRPKDELLLPRYIMYFLLSGHFQKVVDQQKTGSTISHLTQALFSRLQLPVPPLEVQREIVRVLDSFTLLTAELTAELTARKKQYEFYRDNLIKKEQHISEVKKLADVANIYDSLHQTPSYSNSGYSMVRVQDIKGGYVDEDKTLKVDESVWNLFTQKYTPRLNDIVVSRVGSYGNFALIPNDKCCLGQNVALIHPNINPKYLYHVLMSTMTKQWINNNVKGASQKSFSLADIKRVPVPVPKENIQQRIAEVLDNFEAICTDLNIGLPAEIEARQKQYEYYRDLLLTFAETGSMLMTDRQS